MHTGQGMFMPRLLFAHRGSGYVWLSFRTSCNALIMGDFTCCWITLISYFLVMVCYEIVLRFVGWDGGIGCLLKGIASVGKVLRGKGG